MVDNKHFGDNLISGLKELATEIENLQLQTSLGTAEAKKKYEEIKDKFDDKVREAKAKYHSETGPIGDVRRTIEKMEVQFTLGKADAKDWVEDQKKNFKEGIRELKELLAKIS